MERNEIDPAGHSKINDVGMDDDVDMKDDQPEGISSRICWAGGR